MTPPSVTDARRGDADVADRWAGGPEIGATSAEAAALDVFREQVRIVVRPIASPSIIGLFGLATGTFVLAGLQLEWIPADQNRQVAIVLVGFAAASQLLASVLAFLARDVVVASAMCVLGLTWLVTGFVLLGAQPGATSDALGLMLVMSSVLMLVVGLVALRTKVAPGVVFLVASTRFALTAGHQLGGWESWKSAAGVVGVVLAALAVATGGAFLVEAATRKPVPPLGRRGDGILALHGSLLEQLRDTPAEPGVRIQL